MRGQQKQQAQPFEETTIDVRTDEWRATGAWLVALFVGSGTLLVGWGIWDLLSSAVAQAAFATAIVAIGYGVTALLVLGGIGTLIYAASFLVRAIAPLHLSRGVRENGGIFRTDGVVLTLPKDFNALPPQTQEDVLKAFTGVGQQQLPPLPSNRLEQTNTVKRDWRGS